MSRQVGVVSRDVLLAEDGTSFLRGIVEGRHPGPPFAYAMDFDITEVEEGRVVFVGTPSPRFFNPLGTIHGGWTATILDSAMACAVHSTLRVGEGYTTLEMKLNYVRPVMPASGPVRCEGTLIHRGGSVATSEGKLVDAQGKLLAHGTETCMIFGAKAGAGALIGAAKLTAGRGRLVTFAPFTDAAVEARFRALPESLRPSMLRLRQMILEVAAGSPDIGPLTETLKWGEPAWLPRQPRTGTTVRADALKGSSTHYALYVHCQTSLIETYRRHYAKQFSYDGNRALIFAVGSEPPAEPLAHCIALALTYHRWAKR